MEREIGYVDGNLEIERLETDSEDFYRGLFAGVESAIEVYGENPNFNCTYHPSTGKCEKKTPCFGCAASGIETEEPAPDYFKGYDAGYDLGVSFVAEQENEYWRDPLVHGDLDDLFGEIENSDTSEYAKGHQAGFDLGCAVGYEEGLANALVDEVILDSEFLDIAFSLREGLRGLLVNNFENKEYGRKNDFKIFECQHTLLNLVEWWAMEKVYSYWDKKEKEE